LEEIMKLKTMLAVAVLLTVGLSSAAAYADSVNFTLTNPNQYILNSGGALTFDATVSAPTSNGAAVFLNGDSFNVAGGFTLDDTDFFNNFPLSLDPGTSFTGDLFVLTIPPGTVDGMYTGTFTLLGGANAAAQNSLGTVDFSVSVPEPSGLVLLLTGMVGLALGARFKGNLRSLAR
jgi:hypothetical protein